MSKQEVYSDGSLFVTRLKVDGGWIYNSCDKSHQVMGSCFVPDVRMQLAAMAMQGILACPMSEEGLSALDAIESKHGNEEILRMTANSACKYADALLAELSKERK